MDANIVAIVVACVPVVLLGMNLHAQAKTTAKIAEVHEQLNGRLTAFMTALDRRVEDAFAKGRAAGRDIALSGPIAKGQAALEEHLTEQDRVSAERHDEANGKK